MLCMGNVGKYAALLAVVFGKWHSYTGNVTTQEKNPSVVPQVSVMQKYPLPLSEFEAPQYFMAPLHCCKAFLVFRREPTRRISTPL